jgi:hypothetical protein
VPTAPPVALPPRRRATQEINRPVVVPTAAEHFRLWKGGRQGTVCMLPDPAGVQRINHDLAIFTPTGISERWGYDSNFWVQFSRVKPDGKRVMCGSPKQFGLTDPRLEAAPVSEGRAELVPHGVGGSDMGSIMGVLGNLRSMVVEESRASIAGAEARALASIETERIRSKESTALMIQILGMAFAQKHASPPAYAPQPAGVDPAIAKQLAELAASNALLLKKIADLEEEEPEDETDDERVERLMKVAKKKGVVVAAQEYMGEESIEGLMRMLPKIKTKIPEMWALIKPLLKEGGAKILRDLKDDEPAPAAKAAPPAAARVEVRQAPPAPPPPAPAPRRAAAPDEFSPPVS